MIRALFILVMLVWSEAALAEEPARLESADRPIQTLDSITIEGEVAVPQVLFITSRDHPRHPEDLGRPLRPTALAVARRVAVPDRLVVIDDCVSETIKEQ